MKISTSLITLAAAGALAACNAPDVNRTTKAPPGVNNPTAVMQPLTTPSAPPAPAMRDPIASSGNAAAPGTNATLAFQQESVQSATPAAVKGAPPQSQTLAVDAQEAAAKAPTTAAADDAKADVRSQGNGLRTPGTGTDTSANSPRHGTLTKAEESTQMPKAGQANNYSSTALEEDSGRGRKP